MNTFLDLVLDHLQETGKDITQLRYVLPSRRSGLFLSKAIARRISKPIIQPEISSIDDFISGQSRQHVRTDLELLPLFYKAYLQIEQDKADSYDKFLGWAPTILHDFNEVDRHLVDPEKFFDYWKDIRELEEGIKHWSTEENKTELVTKYLRFWYSLKSYYDRFRQLCIDNNVIYDGLSYRKAYQN